MFQDRLHWFGKRLTCSSYIAYVKFSHNVTFYEKIQIWVSATKFSYCRSIIVNWKKKHHDIPTLYSLLKLVKKRINIWPFSYWTCYMPLVLIMASDGCNGPRRCLGHVTWPIRKRPYINTLLKLVPTLPTWIFWILFLINLYLMEDNYPFPFDVIVSYFIYSWF